MDKKHIIQLSGWQIKFLLEQLVINSEMLCETNKEAIGMNEMIDSITAELQKHYSGTIKL